MLIIFFPSLIHTNVNKNQTHAWTHTCTQMVVFLECIFSNQIKGLWRFRIGWVYTCILRIAFISHDCIISSLPSISPFGLLQVLQTVSHVFWGFSSCSLWGVGECPVSAPPPTIFFPVSSIVLYILWWKLLFLHVGWCRKTRGTHKTCLEA
jgi:hypothetical protein